MIATFISATGRSHLIDVSRSTTACGRRYSFGPTPGSAFDLVTCRVCAAHLRDCGRCQDLLEAQQRREDGPPGAQETEK